MTNMMMNGVVAINGGVGVMEIRQPLPQTVESVAQPVENLTVNAHISLRELKNTVAAVIEKKLPKYAQLTIPRYASLVRSVCPWMPMVILSRSMRTISPTMS